MERETIKVSLSGRYAGWEAEMDADPDGRVLVELGSGNMERILRLIPQLVLSWNFKAKDGSEAPLSYEGVLTVPARALGALIKEYGQAFSQLPN